MAAAARACVLALLFLVGFGNAASATLKLRYNPDFDLHFIHFEGEIKAGSLKDLKELITAARAMNPPGQVYLALDSPGGLLTEAMKAGELVRASGVGTVVLPKAICSSACAFLFFAGYDAAARQPRRLAFAGSRIGVHQAFKRYQSERRLEARDARELNAIYASVQTGVGRMLAYLNAMQISPDIQADVFSTPSKGISYITPTQMRASAIMPVRKSFGQWNADSEAGTVALPTGLKMPAGWRNLPLAQSAGARLPGGVFITNPNRPKSGRNGLVSHAGNWAIGTRDGERCLDIDVAVDSGSLSLRLCRGERLSGAIAYEFGVLPGWPTVNAISLVDFFGGIETLSVSNDSAETSFQARDRVRFLVQDRTAGSDTDRTFSEIRIVLRTGPSSREIAFFVPPAAREFVERDVLKPGIR